MLPSPAASAIASVRKYLLTIFRPRSLGHSLVFCSLGIKLIIAFWPFEMVCVFFFWFVGFFF